MLRVRGDDGEAVEIAVPQSVRARAEEIARLSRGLGERGGGFTCAREVLAPALIYGLAHMRERYAQAALREAGTGVGPTPVGQPTGGVPAGGPAATGAGQAGARTAVAPPGPPRSGLAGDEQVLEGEER